MSSQSKATRSDDRAVPLTTREQEYWARAEQLLGSGRWQDHRILAEELAEAMIWRSYHPTPWREVWERQQIPGTELTWRDALTPRLVRHFYEQLRDSYASAWPGIAERARTRPTPVWYADRGQTVPTAHPPADAPIEWQELGYLLRHLQAEAHQEEWQTWLGWNPEPPRPPRVARWRDKLITGITVGSAGVLGGGLGGGGLVALFVLASPALLVLEVLYRLTGAKQLHEHHREWEARRDARYATPLPSPPPPPKSPRPSPDPTSGI